MELKNYYSLTPPEIGMYLEQKLNPSSAEYTIDFGLVIKGAGENEINSAMSEIFTRHESLRSYYSEDNGVPVRVLSDEVPKILWKEASSRAEVENIISANDKAFSLSSIPVQVTGYKLPDESVILHFSVHHIAFDGTSCSIMTKELFSLLKHESLPESQIDVTDIARSERSEEYENGREFYREMFSGGVPVNDMPVKCARPKEYANVIGMFVNLAPLRLKPNADREVNEYVRDVAGLVKTASRESSLPFAEVVKEFSGVRDGSRSPVFDVSVNYRHMPGKIDDGKISIEFIKTLRRVRNDITVTIDRTDSGMKLYVQYSSELFDDGLIARFTEQIRETLRLIQENPNANISDVSILPGEKSYEEDRKYYAEIFSDCDFVSVPDSDVQDDDINGSGFLEIESRHADFGRISRFCSESGITENAFFTGAYGYVLSGFSGDDGALFAVQNVKNDSDGVLIPVLCRVTDSDIRGYLSATGDESRRNAPES